MTLLKPAIQKPLKSFARREGRLTLRQKNAIDTNNNSSLIDIDTSVLKIPALFGRQAPVVLEIGFGMGHALLQMAEASPNTNFIGIDVYRRGIGAVLATLQEKGIKNIRILAGDAQEILPRIPDHTIDGINIFFPDPWPKKRHHKRRLIQPAFVALLEKKLKPGGYLHLATDWEDYALQMLAVLSENKNLSNISPTTCLLKRPMTKYEQRGLNLGHPVWDIIFTKG